MIFGCSLAMLSRAFFMVLWWIFRLGITSAIGHSKYRLSGRANISRAILVKIARRNFERIHRQSGNIPRPQYHPQKLGSGHPPTIPPILHTPASAMLGESMMKHFSNTSMRVLQPRHSISVQRHWVMWSSILRVEKAAEELHTQVARPKHMRKTFNKPDQHFIFLHLPNHCHPKFICKIIAIQISSAKSLPSKFPRPNKKTRHLQNHCHPNFLCLNSNMHSHIHRKNRAHAEIAPTIWSSRSVSIAQLKCTHVTCRSNAQIAPTIWSSKSVSIAHKSRGVIAHTHPMHRLHPQSGHPKVCL